MTIEEVKRIKAKLRLFDAKLLEKHKLESHNLSILILESFMIAMKWVWWQGYNNLGWQTPDDVHEGVYEDLVLERKLVTQDQWDEFTDRHKLLEQ